MQKATFTTKTFEYSLFFKALQVNPHAFSSFKKIVTFLVLGQMNTDMLDDGVQVYTCTS